MEKRPVTELIKQRSRMNAYQISKEIAKMLDSHDHKVYYVGGVVRDRILGMQPFDYDLVTSARIEEIERIVGDRFKFVSIPKYFIVRVSDSDGKDFVDVAEYRRDVTSYGRQQDTVRAKSLEEDLARRDFTINAIAQDAVTDEIFDPFHGRDDIANKVIRAIGNPVDRFYEDYLRIVRGVRFAATYKFKIDLETAAAMMMAPDIPKFVSPERIQAEIMKVVKRRALSRFIRDVKNLGLFEYIGLAEVKKLIGLEQESKYHPEGDVFTHTIMLLDELEKVRADEVTLLAGLFHDIGKPDTTTVDEKGIHSYAHAKVGNDITRKIMREMRFPNDMINDVCQLVLYHMAFAQPGRTMKSIRRLYNVFEQDVSRLVMLSHADINAASENFEHYQKYIEMLAEIKKEPPPMKPLVSGYQVMYILKLVPGPLVGKVLKEVYEMQLEDKIKNSNEAIDFVRKHGEEIIKEEK